ncbi:hypothetical protein [Glycomyces tarimensis]
MSPTSVDPAVPPGQATEADKVLGEYRPHYAVRLTLHSAGPGEAVVKRHRINARIKPEEIAWVAHAGGVVHKITWDDHHQKKQFDWMVLAEHWIRAKIGVDWADQA